MATGHRRGARSRGGGIRIIGGQWRGRRLAVTNRPGLRPTTDRVRETLFNWLQGAVPGARCLDLFAGSGALGLEALSRGAAHCSFVDSDRQALAHLRGIIETLGAADRSSCFGEPARTFLARGGEPFDLVFLDPPFGSDGLADACAGLEASGLCHRDTLVYVETEQRDPTAVLPATWCRHREAHSGAVHYFLYRPRPFVEPG